MLFLLFFVIFILVMAFQAYDGWVETKEIIRKGEKPNVFLILYTSFACFWLFGILIVFYFKMIYREQELYKNPAAFQYSEEGNEHQSQPP